MNVRTALLQQEITEVTKEDIPRHTENDGTCTIDLPTGWSAKVEVRDDETMGPPWEEHDGHGPVDPAWKNVNGRVSKRSAGKRPGERVLLDYHRELIGFYDYAGAVKIARRDGWGCDHTHATKGETAACAANLDFERMRGYCLGPNAGGWGWIGVIATLYDANGSEVSSDSLWGIESDTDYWREVAAELINELARGYCLPGGE